jgi:N12 class adenine-specific DNA methylase/predicted kinase/alkylhydroperoxidase family enzyme
MADDRNDDDLLNELRSLDSGGASPSMTEMPRSPVAPVTAVPGTDEIISETMQQRQAEQRSSHERGFFDSIGSAVVDWARQSWENDTFANDLSRDLASVAGTVAGHAVIGPATTQTGKSFIQGTRGVASEFGRGMQTMGESVARRTDDGSLGESISQGVAGYGKSMADQNEELLKNPFWKPSAPQSAADIRKENFVSDLGEYAHSTFFKGMGSIVPIVAAGIASGGAVLPVLLPTMGIGAIRKAFDDNGVKPEDHEDVLYAAGIAHGALEYIPGFKQIMTAFSHEAKKEVSDHLIKSLVKGFAAGGVKEGTTEFLQTALELTAPVYAKTRSLADAYGVAHDDLLKGIESQMLESFIQGAIAGGPLEGGSRALVRNRPEKKPDGPATPTEGPDSATYLTEPDGKARPGSSPQLRKDEQAPPAKAATPDPYLDDVANFVRTADPETAQKHGLMAQQVKQEVAQATDAEALERAKEVQAWDGATATASVEMDSTVEYDRAIRGGTARVAEIEQEIAALGPAIKGPAASRRRHLVAERDDLSETMDGLQRGRTRQAEIEAGQTDLFAGSAAPEPALASSDGLSVERRAAIDAIADKAVRENGASRAQTSAFGNERDYGTTPERKAEMAYYRQSLDRYDHETNNLKTDRGATSGQPAGPAAPPNPQSQLASLIAGKTPAKSWAKQLGVSDAQMKPMLDAAAKQGLIRVDAKGAIRRTPKAKTAQTVQLPATEPGPVTKQTFDGGFSITIDPSFRALKRAESIERQTGTKLTEIAKDYAGMLETAGTDQSAFTAVMTDIRKDRAVTKKVLDEIVTAYTGTRFKAKTKGDAFVRLKALFDTRSERAANAVSTTLRGDAQRVPEEGVSDAVSGNGEIGPAGGTPLADRGGSDGDVGRPVRTDDGQSGPADGLPGEGEGDGGNTGTGAGDRELGANPPPASASLSDEQQAAVADQVAAEIERQELARADRETLNYQITPADQIGKGGPKAKVRGNIDAIRILRVLQEEKRPATVEEKAKLVKYVGWGAFSQDVFADHKPEWKAERNALKDLLTPAEYAAARASTTNAHYTSPEVITAMWDALEHMGFKGGRVIEPAAGIGHFIGLMPGKLRADTAWTAVELDILSGEITKALYGAADVRVAGFETQKWPDNHFDLAISNVPFAAEGPYDPTYKNKFTLHDYFFIKGLDKVRPGGIVAFITSSGTLDKAGTMARREMDRRGTFLGAVRLPGGNQGAFKANAGTDVTTDIIFFRKKMEGEPDRNPEWRTLSEVKTPEGATDINGYFAAHPDMMLGKMRLIGKMYGKGEPVLIGSTDGLGMKVVNAIADNIPAGSMIPRGVAAVDQPRQDVDTETDGIKEGSFYEKDGTLYRKVQGVGEPQNFGKEAAAKVRGFIGLRSIVNDMLAKQARGDRAGMDDYREALGKAYDDFVERYGPINRTIVTKQTRKDGKEVVIRRKPTLSLFQEDPDAFKVAAVEVYDEKSDTAKKAAIFNQDIVGSYQTPAITGPSDALAVSLNETGKVDMPLIAKRLGLNQAEAIASLDDQVFENPAGEIWQTNAEYLAGDVVEKLDQARIAAELDPMRYRRNVESLEKVQPEQLTRSEITIPFGAPWVPAEVYEKFLEEKLGGHRVELVYNEANARWNVLSGHFPLAANDTYGTARKNLVQILDYALNSNTVVITDTVQSEEGETRVRVPEAEAEARAKIDAIRDLFSGNSDLGVDGWAWEDMQRADRLEKLYNHTFNRIVPQKYDGSHLTFPGLARVVTFPDGTTGTINLLPHRVNAIWRVIQRGNTLFNHVVGSGKTWTAIMASMEMKRLGMVQRPMFVVPNHMLEQFSTEFYQAYPNAKLLVATKDQMSRDRRREFAAKVASDTWDGIIITHSAFTRVGMSPDTYREYYELQIQDLLDAKDQAAKDEGEDSPTVKDLEKAKKRLENRLKRLTDEESKDDGVTFEELGVDFMFVDEAHTFKSLHFATRHGRVRGISNKGESKRATDLYVKMGHLEKSRPGRSAVFMTGTLVSNTMAELYTMQRYLQGPMLRKYGLHQFDSWAGTFGKIVTKSELSSNSRDWVDTESFSQFVNMPELMSLVGEVMDTQTADMLKLPRPNLKGGKIEAVEVDLSETEESAIQGLIEEMEEAKGKKPGEGAPFISLFTKGIQLATDMRLVDPTAPFNPTGKIGRAVSNIFDIWKDGNVDPAAPNKAQLVFLDMGVPGSRGRRSTVTPATGTSGATVDTDIADVIRRELLDEARGTSEDAEVEAEVDEAEVEAKAMLVGKFNLYEDMKVRLIEKGIPADQIAFIHDANTDDKKAKLFERVRNGEVRVLFGSTGKMGVGTNVQRQLIAMHHLDAPWKPADVEQRDGRILRQGNKNPEVRILRYITKRSFDAYRWQLLDRKSIFIGQMFAGALGVRNAEDINPPLPEAAELKAAATGNPLIMEHAELSREVRQLQVAERGHVRSHKAAAANAATIRSMNEKSKADLAPYEEDALKVTDLAGDKFSVTLDVGTDGPVGFKERKKAGEAIRGYLHGVGSRIWGGYGSDSEIGTISGFQMKAIVKRTSDGILVKPEIVGVRDYSPMDSFLITETSDPVQLVRRWERMVAAIPEHIEMQRGRIARWETELPGLDKAAQPTPFPRADELRRKTRRLQRLEGVLKFGKTQSPDDAKAEAAYVEQGMANLKATSRTAAGIVDISASVGKAGQMAEGLTGDLAARSAVENFQGVISDIYRRREQMALLKPSELAKELDKIALAINRGILKEGALYREDDSDKFPYTRVADLPAAYKQFSEELAARLDDENADPVETAAWIEWRTNMTDHVWADGVGKTSKALAAIPLMRAGLSLPRYRANKEYFAFSQKAPVDPSAGGQAYLGQEWQKFLAYYRTLMAPEKFTEADYVEREAAIRQTLNSEEWTRATIADMSRDTEKQPGYGSPEWKAARTYNTPQGEIVGYDNAVQFLIDDAIEKIPGGAQKNERKLFILLGMPGSGKSTIAKKVGERHGAAHMVGDDAKLLIPEYDDGKNSGGVHEEASNMMKDAVARMVSAGGNIIVEKLGSSSSSINKLVDQFSANGYQITVVHVSVPKALAMERAVMRWRKTGRAVPTTEFDLTDSNIPKLLAILEEDRRVNETAKVTFNERADRWEVAGLPGLEIEGLWPRAGATSGNPRVDGVDRRPVVARGGERSGAAQGSQEEVAQAEIAKAEADLSQLTAGASQAPVTDDTSTPQFMFGGPSSPDAGTGQSMRRDLDALGYYSKALEAARGLKQAKGTPEQMLAQLKSAGVKDAEIEATKLGELLAPAKEGVIETLEMRPLVPGQDRMSDTFVGEWKPQGDRTASPPRRASLKQVTKSEIVKFLEENRVQVKEVQYGGQIDGTTDTQDLGGGLVDDDMMNDLVGGGAYTETSTVPSGAAGPTKWARHSLDSSNPTYRETVLHLPESRRAQEIEARMKENQRVIYDISEQAKDLRATPDFAPLRAARSENAALLSELKEIKASNFQSGHFPEPNIIGHMMTSMTTHRGKPVFTIDQIQSDWGQNLRDGGVRDEAKIAELKAKAKAADDRVGDLRAQAKPYIDEYLADLPADHRSRMDWTNLTNSVGATRYEDIPPGHVRSFLARIKKLDPTGLPTDLNVAISEQGLLRAELATAEAGSPGNPLVNTTDQWVNTVLRRAIRQASEAGADYIAIPSGDTVLSYNPGDDAGMRFFYGGAERPKQLKVYKSELERLEKGAASGVSAEEHAAGLKAAKRLVAQNSAIEGIVPKNLRNLIAKIDKASPSPERIETLDSPSGKTGLGKGFTLFPLTEAVKRSVMEEGQPLFRLAAESQIGNLGSFRPGYAERKAAIVADIEAEIARMAPRDVAIRVADHLAQQDQGEPVGFYEHGSRLLAVTLAYGPDTARGGAWHETVHALREAGAFTAAEWKSLLDRAAKIGIDEKIRTLRPDGTSHPALPEYATTYYLQARRMGMNDMRDVRDFVVERLNQERVARMAQDWSSGTRYGAAIDALLSRMVEIMQAIKTVLNKYGFNDLADLFERAEVSGIRARMTDGVLRDRIKSLTTPEQLEQRAQVLALYVPAGQAVLEQWGGTPSFSFGSSVQRPATQQPFSAAGMSGSVSIRTNEDGTELRTYSIGDGVASLVLSRDAMGRHEVASIRVKDEMLGRGVSSALFDAVERDLSTVVSSNGWLSEDAYRYWQKRNGESVAHHVNGGPMFDGAWIGPAQLDRMIAAMEAANEPDRLQYLIELRRGIPPEALAQSRMDVLFGVVRGAARRASELVARADQDGLGVSLGSSMASVVDYANTVTKLLGGMPLFSIRAFDDSQTAMPNEPTADPDTFAVARDMASNGSPEIEIFLSTGWARDGRGNWQFIGLEQAIADDNGGSGGGAAPQFMFGKGRDRKVKPITEIIANLKDVLGMNATQGLYGLTVEGVQTGKKSRTFRPTQFVAGQYDRLTGTQRYRLSTDIDNVAHEGGHHIERLFGTDLAHIKMRHRAELEALSTQQGNQLSEGFANFFRDYILRPDHVQQMAPNFLAEFEDFLDGHGPEILEAIERLHLLQSRQEWQDYIRATDLERAHANLKSEADNSFTKRFSDFYESIGQSRTISGFSHAVYEAGVDQNHQWYLAVSKFLARADENLKADDKGRAISLAVHENPYKLMRSIGDSFKTGLRWIQDGMPNYRDTSFRSPSLHDALSLAMGKTWSLGKHQSFGVYLESRRAAEEWKVWTAKQYKIADIAGKLSNIDAVRPALADLSRKLSDRVERLISRQIGDATLVQDRQRSASAAEKELADIGQRLDQLKDELAGAEMATAMNSDERQSLISRKQRQIAMWERKQADAVRRMESVTADRDEREIGESAQGNMLEQLQAQAEDAANRLKGIDTYARELSAELADTKKNGMQRNPHAISQDIHEQRIERLESENPTFKDAAQMVYDFQWQQVLHDQQAGRLTQAEVDYRRTRKDWYVPFARDISDVDADAAGPGGAGIKRFSKDKRFLGSDRNVIHPIETIMDQTFHRAAATHYNEVILSLKALAERVGPGGSAIAEVVDQSEIVEASAAEFDRLREHLVSLGYDAHDADEMIKRIEHDFTDTQLLLKWAPGSFGAKRPLLIPYWENGDRKMIRINDPEFAAGVVETLNGIGREMSSLMIDMIAKPATLLRMGVTTHPAFIATNILRDMVSAWTLTGSIMHPSTWPIITQARGLYHEVAQTDMARLYQEVAGLMGGQNVAALSAARDKVDVMALKAKGLQIKPLSMGLSMAAGGIAGGMMMGPAGAMSGAMVGAATHQSGSPSKWFANLAYLSDMSETATRLGVFTQAYKAALAYNPSLTPYQAAQEAAFVARDLIDFGRHGSRMLVAAKLVPFLNAQIQGLDKAQRTFLALSDRGKELSSAKMGGAIVVAGALGTLVGGPIAGSIAGTVTAAILAHAAARVDSVRELLAPFYKQQNGLPLSADSEKALATSAMAWTNLVLYTGVLLSFMALYRDDDEYRRINARIKNKAQPVKINGEWYQIPKAFELAIPSIFIEAAIDAQTKGDPNFWERVNEGLWDSLSPPLVPQAVRMWRDIGANYNSLSKRSIISEHMQALPPQEQFGAYASHFAISLSRMVNESTAKKPVEKVGSAIFQNKFELTPAIIDYALQSGLGYWGKDIQKTSNVSRPNGPRTGNIIEYPLIGTMVQRFQIDPDRASDAHGAYYEVMGKQGDGYIRAAKGYEHYLKLGLVDQNGRAQANAYLATLESDEARAYAVIEQQTSNRKKNAHPLNRARDMLRVVKGLQGDILTERLVDSSSRTEPVPIKLTPKQADSARDVLNTLAAIETENALIALRHKQFATRKLRDPQPAIDLLASISMELANQFDLRVSRGSSGTTIFQKVRIPDWKETVEGWPVLRDEMLEGWRDAGSERVSGSRRIRVK